MKRRDVIKKALVMCIVVMSLSIFGKVSANERALAYYYEQDAYEIPIREAYPYSYSSPYSYPSSYYDDASPTSFYSYSYPPTYSWSSSSIGNNYNNRSSYDPFDNFPSGVSSYQGTSTGPGPNGGYPGTPHGQYKTNYYSGKR